MYSVVVFAPDDCDGDEEVEAVPSVWLSPNRSHCQWPPMRSQESIARAMREKRIPEPSWSTHVAKVLKTCDDFGVARQKAKKAEVTSDLDTAPSDKESRKSRAKAFADEDACSESLMKKRPGKKVPLSAALLLPPPPPATLTTATSSQLPASTPPAGSHVEARHRSPPPPSSGSSRILASTPPAGTSLNARQMSSASITATQASKRDKVFIQHLVELKAQVQLNTQMLQSQMKLLQDLQRVAGKGGLEGASSTAPTLPTGVSLPLKSLQQLQRLEHMLRATTSERKKLVTYLGMIGGVTVKDTTRRVMSALFSNMLAVQFNFKGHGTKHAFSQLLLKDVVNDAVRYNRLTQTASSDEVERVVRDWLRTARDRDGGRRRRDAAKLTAAAELSALPAADSADDDRSSVEPDTDIDVI